MAYQSSLLFLLLLFNLTLLLATLELALGDLLASDGVGVEVFSALWSSSRLSWGVCFGHICD